MSQDNYALRTLLWTLVVCGAGAISLCSTTVYLGADGIAEKFHTDSFDNLDTDLKYFCAKHNIYDEECDKIRNYHTMSCFNDQAEPAHGLSKISPDDKDSRKEVSDDMYKSEVREDSFEEYKATSSLRSGIVDYSQSYGPTLPVTLLDKTHHLKMYFGETPSKALKRFCLMLRLKDEQCFQVKVRYHEMCREEGINDETLEEELSEADSRQASPTEKRSPMQKEDNLIATSVDIRETGNQQGNTYDNYPAPIRRIIDLCEEYWNLIALVIIILYVATEHLQ